MKSWQIHHIRDSAESVHSRELPAERSIWRASITESAIVLGSKQSFEIVNQQACDDDGVSVVRRRSGGGAAVALSHRHRRLRGDHRRLDRLGLHLTTYGLIL